MSRADDGSSHDNNAAVEVVTQALSGGSTAGERRISFSGGAA
jgi:hypothetical protein